ncbi:MAG TPA: lysophospholipid acyltransferase family protein [Longimicrobiales bacterium]|nr:lysophospholipid acyltransferase family protein [Longimicrobiales bacterium]
MIRLLLMALLVVPVTGWYVARILWAVYTDAPNKRCVCEWVPRKWAQVLCRIAGARVVLENEEAIDPEVPQILVANHASWFDVLALAGYTPGRYCFVAKKEVEKVPGFGRAVRVCGHIYIDREDHKKAVASMQVVREKLEKERPTVIMFPEGTRSATGELQRFKKGAFVLAIQTGADIVPTAIVGSRHVMRKHSLLIRAGTVRIRFGDPIPVAALGLEHRDELMVNSRDRLERLLAAPVESPDNENRRGG